MNRLLENDLIIFKFVDKAGHLQRMIAIDGRSSDREVIEMRENQERKKASLNSIISVLIEKIIPVATLVFFFFYPFGYSFMYGFYFGKAEFSTEVFLPRILNYIFQLVYQIPFNFKNLVIVGFVVTLLLFLYYYLVFLCITEEKGDKPFVYYGLYFGIMLSFYCCVLSVVKDIEFILQNSIFYYNYLIIFSLIFIIKLKKLMDSDQVFIFLWKFFYNLIKALLYFVASLYFLSYLVIFFKEMKYFLILLFPAYEVVFMKLFTILMKHDSTDKTRKPAPDETVSKENKDSKFLITEMEEDMESDIPKKIWEYNNVPKKDLILSLFMMIIVVIIIYLSIISLLYSFGNLVRNNFNFLKLSTIEYNDSYGEIKVIEGVVVTQSGDKFYISDQDRNLVIISSDEVMVKTKFN